MGNFITAAKLAEFIQENPGLFYKVVNMHYFANTLDDLLRRVYPKILENGCEITPSRGDVIELSGVLLQISNPRARLSRTETKGKIFSCLGEFLWYLSKKGELKFIQYYLKQYAKESEDNQTIHGAYGPRLFNMHNQHNQIINVIKLLKEKKTSRRAVIQIFDASDISRKYQEIPCTVSLQFMIRNNCLDMLTCMRSNDAYFGLPHDVFAFTMLQEVLARSLGIELGQYKHFVGSLHLYQTQLKKVKYFLNEGWHEEIEMPSMPIGDPFPCLSVLTDAEEKIRLGNNYTISNDLDAYWSDLIRLLQIYNGYKNKDKVSISKLKKSMISSVYSSYIEKYQSSCHKKSPRS